MQGTLNLLHVMQQHNVHKIVFSSSATVYGEPKVSFECLYEADRSYLTAP